MEEREKGGEEQCGCIPSFSIKTNTTHSAPPAPPLSSISASSLHHPAFSPRRRSVGALHSFISLSGARCPGTASVQDVVINGSMKAPLPFFSQVAHTLLPTLCLCSCTTVRCLMAHAAAINLLRCEKEEGQIFN